MPRKLREKIEGTKIGEWSVLHYDSHGYYMVRCSCGKEKLLLSGRLKSGASKSCGHGGENATRTNNIKARVKEKFIPKPKYDLE